MMIPSDRIAEEDCESFFFSFVETIDSTGTRQTVPKVIALAMRFQAE